MGNFWQDLRDVAHRVDPIGANLVDNMIRTDSRVVAEVSRGHDRVFGGSDGQTGLGRGIRDESRRNIKDPSRAVGRAAATLALMYGAYAYGGGAAAGGGGAAASGGAAATGGTAAMGGTYGTASYMGGALGVGATGAEATALASGGQITLGAGAAAGAGYYAGDAAAAGYDPAYGQAAQTAATPNTPTAASPYRRAAESVGTGIATNYVTSLLAPKPDTPQVEPVTPMPDPEAQAAARKRKAALRARQGRVSSILTAPGGY